MSFIADILLAAGAIGAAFYCFVLGRRLRNFNDLQKGMGGAVAVLSAQVDDLEKTLGNAQQLAANSAQELEALTARAEDVRRQLELQMAALHDVVPQQVAPAENAPAVAPPVTPPAESAEPMFTRNRAGGRA
jgi:peptidoglycan hydrolase CwlO-like protein